MPKISPRCSVKVAEPAPNASTSRIGSASLPRAARIEIVDGAPDHQADDRGALGGVRRGRSCDTAVTQHDDPIGDLFHFFDEMRDVDDGVALALQLRDDVEEPSRVFAAQAAGRFVQDQHAAPTASALAISTICCKATERMPAGASTGMIAVAQPCQRLASRAREPAASSPGRARVGSSPSTTFSMTRQVRRERQLLIDHRDAGSARVERDLRGL